MKKRLVWKFLNRKLYTGDRVKFVGSRSLAHGSVVGVGRLPETVEVHFDDGTREATISGHVLTKINSSARSKYSKAARSHAVKAHPFVGAHPDFVVIHAGGTYGKGHKPYGK